MRVNGNAVGSSQSPQLIQGIRLQVQGRDVRRPESSFVKHGRKVAAPGSIGVDGEREAFCFVLAAHVNKLGDWIAGAVLGRTDDGHAAKHGGALALVVGRDACVEVSPEVVYVHARFVVHLDIDEAGRAEAGDG